jgi:hypothetical protein
MPEGLNPSRRGWRKIIVFMRNQNHQSMNVVNIVLKVANYENYLTVWFSFIGVG